MGEDLLVTIELLKRQTSCYSEFDQVMITYVIERLFLLPIRGIFPCLFFLNRPLPIPFYKSLFMANFPHIQDWQEP